MIPPPPGSYRGVLHLSFRSATTLATRELLSMPGFIVKVSIVCTTSSLPYSDIQTRRLAVRVANTLNTESSRFSFGAVEVPPKVSFGGLALEHRVGEESVVGCHPLGGLPPIIVPLVKLEFPALELAGQPLGLRPSLTFYLDRFWGGKSTSRLRREASLGAGRQVFWALDPPPKRNGLSCEVLSAVDNQMQLGYILAQDRRGTRISSLRVEMGNPGLGRWVGG